MNALNGLRILNTRPIHKMESLNNAIREHGGIPISLPALAIEPTPLTWLHHLPSLGSVDHAIFTSTDAVCIFFNTLREKKINWPLHILVTAIGSATAEALRNEGVIPFATPPSANSEELLRLSHFKNVSQHTILLVKGEGGRPLLPNVLTERNAKVLPLEVYRRTLPIVDKVFVSSLWQENAIDIILFTSEEAMNNVFRLFGERAKTWLTNKPCIVISQRLAKAAVLLDIKTILVSDYKNVIDTCIAFVANRIDAR